MHAISGRLRLLCVYRKTSHGVPANIKIILVSENLIYICNMNNTSKCSVSEAKGLLDEARKWARDLYESYIQAKINEKNLEPRIRFRPEGRKQMSIEELDGNVARAKLYFDEGIFVNYNPGTIYEIPGFIESVWYRDEDDEVVLDIYDITDGKIKTAIAYPFEESELVCEFLNRYDNANLKF